MTDPKETYKTKMTSEMSQPEWDCFRSDWIEGWAKSLQSECDMSEEDAKDCADIDWEKYCGQEGFTRRDLDISEARDSVERASEGEAP